MRHNKKFNHLGRTKAHRDAMLSNMATSLILHKRIFTTLAKAKALRVYVEPLINRAKEDTTASRRVVFRYLQSKEAVTELFKEISVKIADRPGGYTRILKTGNRLGDNAKTCFIELVDYNENMLKESVKKGIKEGLEGLAGQIPGLIDVHVNINGLESSTADVMLDTTFESVDALKAYAVNPKHVAVADGKVRPYTAIRSCLEGVSQSLCKPPN